MLLKYLKRAAAEQFKELKFPATSKVTISEAIDDLASEEYIQCPDAKKFMTNKYLPVKSQYAKLPMRANVNGHLPNSTSVQFIQKN